MSNSKECPCGIERAACTYHNGEPAKSVELTEADRTIEKSGTIRVTGIDKNAGTIQATSTATFPAHFGSSHVLPADAYKVVSVSVHFSDGVGFRLTTAGEPFVPTGVSYEISGTPLGVGLRCQGEIPDKWRKNAVISVTYTTKPAPVEPKCGPRELAEDPTLRLQQVQDLMNAGMLSTEQALNLCGELSGTFASTDRTESWKAETLSSPGYLAEVKKVVDDLKTTSANEILKRRYPQDKLSDFGWLRMPPVYSMFNVDRSVDTTRLGGFRVGVDSKPNDLLATLNAEMASSAQALAKRRTEMLYKSTGEECSYPMVPKEPEVISLEQMDEFRLGLGPVNTLTRWLFKNGHRDELTMHRGDYLALVEDAGNEWGGHRFEVGDGGVNFAGPEGYCFITPEPRKVAA